MEEPLLSSERNGELGEKGSEKWSSYQYVGRAGSVIPTAALAGTEVSVEEIRSAATYSDHYPPSLRAALVSPQEPDPSGVQICVLRITKLGLLSSYESLLFAIALSSDGTLLKDIAIPDEVEIRELLIDHVGHRCCWGSHPARTWKIEKVEDCNLYVGTLDTFIEERETIRETQPYLGGSIDGKDKGPELGIWALDLKSQFPVIFIPHHESRAIIPHSESIEKCSGCGGRGDIVCPKCNANQEPGFYKENQMAQCSACYGRGLIAHKDGSDSICGSCNGKGKIPCASCGSRGLIRCLTCQGSGSLLTHKVAVVKWKTLSTRKVSAASGAASVPDDVFHRAKGVQLCNTQAYPCSSAFFADSFFLNQFSSEVIADRAPVPLTARVISERHTISVVPVTRVTMAHRSRLFSFYIIGFSREVYLKDYYPPRFCWGLCPCLEWLKL
ncbi:protein SSUH2 homolog [Pyrus x bretschneideri]|uniref:protein SSUH2 homolog n=1 Tax=Pyrus x bretschneideri TaxID=225117 RepID=UPI00202FA606|nr:protein SSUH2 homolog [Pyrus x bretschneideri]